MKFPISDIYFGYPSYNLKVFDVLNFFYVSFTTIIIVTLTCADRVIIFEHVSNSQTFSRYKAIKNNIYSLKVYAYLDTSPVRCFFSFLIVPFNRSLHKYNNKLFFLYVFHWNFKLIIGLYN